MASAPELAEQLEAALPFFCAPEPLNANASAITHEILGKSLFMGREEIVAMKTEKMERLFMQRVFGGLALSIAALCIALMLAWAGPLLLQRAVISFGIWWGIAAYLAVWGIVFFFLFTVVLARMPRFRTTLFLLVLVMQSLILFLYFVNPSVVMLKTL